MWLGRENAMTQPSEFEQVVADVAKDLEAA